MKKLEAFSRDFFSHQSPLEFNFRQLSKFIEWIAELGFSDTTQARIVSGIKTFYKYLVLENEIKDSPAESSGETQDKTKTPCVFIGGRN